MPAAAGAEVVGVCPACGDGELRVVKREQETIMGELGPRIDTVECDNPGCGCRETRIHLN
jgi:hypothetical protein